MAELTTGAPQVPGSVGATSGAQTVAAPAAPAAAPTTQTPAEQDDNPWVHTDEYDPDPSALADPNAAPAASQATQDLAQPQSAHPEVPPAGALNADKTSAQTTEGQQPPGTAPGPIPYERFQEVNTKATKMQEMAEFYQQQYNDLVAQTQGATPPAQAKPGEAGPNAADPNAAPGAAEPGKLPAGIKGPGEWDTQEDMAAYHDHVAKTAAQTLVGRVYQQHIAPQMQAMNKFVGTLEDMVIHSVHKDFDEVVTPAMAELFVTDHEGKVWTDPQGNPKVKNPALLNWLRQSPSPRKALYDYALAKRAPQKITEAVQSTTKQLLQALDTRPKGPTQPRQAGGDNKPAALDWDTPRDVADKVLSEQGVI